MEDETKQNEPEASKTSGSALVTSEQADTRFIDLEGDAPAGASKNTRRKLFAGIATVACLALIVVSLGFIYPTNDVSWSLDWIVRPASQMVGEPDWGSSASASKSTEASGNAGENDQADSEAPSEESNDAKKSNDSKAEDSKDAKASEVASGKKKSNATKSTNQSSGAAAETSSASSSSSSSTGSRAASQGASQNSSSNVSSQQAQKSTVTVSVSVSSSVVGSPVSSSGSFTFNKGATVYDALCALGLSVNAGNTQYGVYVAAIGGLAEKEHGNSSGWMYAVNGSTPMTACSNYVLNDGDNVSWYYVV